MPSAAVFKITAGPLALAALVCGLMAACCSMRAGRVTPDPGWTPPGALGPSEPGLPEFQQVAWTVATLTAMQASGRYSRTAGLWTIAAVLLAALGSILGLFPL